MTTTTKLYRALTALFATALCVSAADAAILSLESSASSVTAGSGFDVLLNISNLSSATGDSLSGFDVNLLYDPTVFQWTGYQFVDNATGMNQLDFPESGALSFDGNVSDSGGVLDAYGVSGNSDVILDANQADAFTFLSLHFVALTNPGLSDINLDMQDPNLMFLDSQFGDLNMSYASTDVQINVTNGGGPLPEPATLALSALGLGLMGLARRC